MPSADCNGVCIYYELHGPGDRPVLVLNNGILMNAAASWNLQVPALSSDYRVVLYDCRGQGQSDHPPGPYSMTQHAHDLAALLDALAIDSAHLLGISYGGEVSQAFALEHPRRVRSLVLADTVSEVGPELRLIVEGWRAAALGGDPDLFYLVTAPWNFSADFIARHTALIAAARMRYHTLDLPAVVRLCDAFLAVNFTGRLSEIKAPTCILVGERDLLKGVRYAEILRRGIAGSRLHVLPGAGHAASWESPALFNELTLAFLAQAGA